MPLCENCKKPIKKRDMTEHIKGAKRSIHIHCKNCAHDEVFDITDIHSVIVNEHDLTKPIRRESNEG